MAQGKKNVYRCSDCNETIATIDRDQGVTPFMIRCKADNCKGMMESNFYRVAQNISATYEWYSPDEAERLKLKDQPAVLDHVEMGGLLLREINNG